MQTDTVQSVISIVTNQDLIAKVLMSLLATMYLFFSFILLRQVLVLNKVVDQVAFSPILKSFVFLNVIFAGVILIAIILLI